ncbi:hypothetical protein QAD02_008370 [Eretmocerus hayati]|uniref:Uncharacterized protein n=1 Tax=Eretmocerus hayati TaxID=131215 RepID=A0ACC2N7M5_9HYME|nr:hypothetical protein QAD02_008370 [Eretmocerus hayati]
MDMAQEKAKGTGSEQSEEDRGRRIDGRIKSVRKELYDCLFSESSNLNKVECRGIILEFVIMEELLNEGTRCSSTLKGKLDESRRESLHLHNFLAAQTIIKRAMKGRSSTSASVKDTQPKQEEQCQRRLRRDLLLR